MRTVEAVSRPRKTRDAVRMEIKWRGKGKKSLIGERCRWYEYSGVKYRTSAYRCYRRLLRPLELEANPTIDAAVSIGPVCASEEATFAAVFGSKPSDALLRVKRSCCHSCNSEHRNPTSECFYWEVKIPSTCPSTFHRQFEPN